MLKNIDSGTPRADAEDLGVPTIIAKKHRWWAPWEAVLEIQECPPSMLKNVDNWPLGRQC
jgi:hypothetical protein